MKTVLIPKGVTVSYESLVTEDLIVKGCLRTTYGIKAKHISGNGVISAGEISADTIRAREIEAAAVICKKLVAERVSAPEVFASDSAAVSCFLSAAYVETGKLTVSVSEIDEVKADEVINLPKRHGLLGTLIASALRSFWLSLTAKPERGEEDKPAETPEPPEPDTETPAEPKEDFVPDLGAEEDDFELKRVIALFKLARDTGYTLRLVPGKPEENAPVFNQETEQILRPAA